MISINDFRKFIDFMNEKICPLARRYKEFESAATEIAERAQEIERKYRRDITTVVEQSKEHAQSETAETDLENNVLLQAQTATSSTAADQESEEHGQPDSRPKRQVKKRKTRVEQKMNNQVCTNHDYNMIIFLFRLLRAGI